MAFELIHGLESDAVDAGLLGPFLNRSLDFNSIVLSLVTSFTPTTFEREDERQYCTADHLLPLVTTFSVSTDNVLQIDQVWLERVH